MRLSDAIEQFIKTMLTQEAPEVELKRNELAEYFNCAPSQINYVLATRFTPDHGYIIESRRGGGGYIRIFRMAQDTSEHLLYLLHQRVGDSIDALAASGARGGHQGRGGHDERGAFAPGAEPSALGGNEGRASRPDSEKHVTGGCPKGQGSIAQRRDIHAL